jgi:hypothetical protein
VRKTTPLAFPDKEESMQFPIAIHNWIYLILSLVGLFVIVSALRSKRQADTSQDWLGVQGKIIESRIEKRESTDYDGSSTTHYTAIVRYTYSVMGEEFTGDRVAFGIKAIDKNSANEIINRYPVDNTVMIYYDPNNPGQAVLERVTKTGWLQVVIGIALFLAGIYLAIK